MANLILVFMFFTYFLSCGKSTEPDLKIPPVINSFTINPVQILITENAVISWNVSGADSISIRDFDTTFVNIAKGSYTVLPTKSATYTAIAYNQYGLDSAKVDVSVKGFGATNGNYYKAIMGTDITNKPLELILLGVDGQPFEDTIITVSILEGDGTLLENLVTTDVYGKATISYTFDGLLGHAILRAVAPSIDTIDLYLRANTLILEDTALGNKGQAQYIKFDDTFGDIKKYNGEPNSIDILGPDVIIVVANYEAALGMVALIYDPDTDGIIDDNSHVFGVAVVDSVFPQLSDSLTLSARYEGKTADSIGIGSKFWRDIFGPLGAPFPSIGTAQPDPLLPSIKITYDSRHLEFLCDTADTGAFQILMFEELDTSLFLAPPTNLENQLYPALRRYFR